MNELMAELQRGLNLHCKYDQHQIDQECPVCEWFKKYASYIDGLEEKLKMFHVEQSA